MIDIYVNGEKKESVNSYMIDTKAYYKSEIKSIDCKDVKWTNNSMEEAFSGCASLISISNINEDVNNVAMAFYECPSLTGDIVFKNTEITDATNCFWATRLDKNVYIPFTYEDGTHTTTYNSFIAAKYTTDGSYEGVYLKDLSELNK